MTLDKPRTKGGAGVTNSVNGRYDNEGNTDMRTSRIRQITAVGALALIVPAPVAGLRRRRS